MPVDLLQRDDVRLAHFSGDSCEIVAAIPAAPELDVVTDELHAFTARAANARFTSFCRALARVSSSMPQSGARMSCPFDT